MKTYPYLNILMFPTTGCNLRCKYCFHAEGSYEKEQMSIQFIDKVFEKLFSTYEYLHFIWHGGEPLLTGLDFYKQVMDLEKYYKDRYNVLVDNAIMTNGTLIDEETAAFFKVHCFDVGVSYDGIENDILRGKTKQVVDGIRLLKEYECDLDIVTIITNSNVAHQVENYEHIKRFQVETKFNPVAKIGGGKNYQSFDLNVDLYIEECKKILDYWLHDRNDPIVLDPYYTYFRDILENTSSGCQRTSCLGRWIALHPNGDVYPCVREGRKEFCFGNILAFDNVEDIWDNDAFMYLMQTSIKRRESCQKCEFFKYCHGGCPINSITDNGDFNCRSFREIFKSVQKYYEDILQMSKEERADSLNPIVEKLFLLHNR